ncbi:hypothetical protein DRQ00_08650, partial [candidate division KSB1 bacterium]
PRDVIFKLRESNPILFDTGADFIGKMELLPVLWTHFRYLFLWEDSTFVGGLSRARLHQRLETIPSASGDASYICFQGGMEHVFCEIAIFQQNLGKR